MIRLPFHLLLALLFTIVGQTLRADIVVIDFGSGNSASNSQGSGAGNWNAFPDASTLLSLGTVSTTISGLKITMSGSASDGNATDDETWGITKEGIGIYTDGAPGAKRRRLDGNDGESITFSFNKDVELISFRMGDAGKGDTVTLTPAGGSAIKIVHAKQAVTFDFFLDSAGDGTGSFTFVPAGTNLVFTTTVGDVLLNEVTVNTVAVPEPLSWLIFGSTAMLDLWRRRTR